MLQVIDQVEKVWGNVSDITAVWLQDWTGQRNFTGTTDLPRVGLWWNWEVNFSFTSITMHVIVQSYFNFQSYATSLGYLALLTKFPYHAMSG